MVLRSVSLAHNAGRRNFQQNKKVADKRPRSTGDELLDDRCMLAAEGYHAQTAPKTKTVNGDLLFCSTADQFYEVQRSSKKRLPSPCK